MASHSGRSSSTSHGRFPLSTLNTHQHMILTQYYLQCELGGKQGTNGFGEVDRLDGVVRQTRGRPPQSCHATEARPCSKQRRA